MGFVVLIDDVKGVVLHIFLNRGVIPLPPDEPLHVEDGVLWIGRQLIFSSITNKTFAVSVESNVRWSYSVSLFVRDDFNMSVFKNSNTEISNENDMKIHVAIERK